MKILAIETATVAGGVALMDDLGLIAEYRLRLEARHSERLLSVIDHLLNESETKLSSLDGIAVSIGPGSFTGLRVGLSTAKGLAMGKETPLVLVPTMEAMAATFPFSRGVIAPLLDARRGEIFWSLFDNRDGVLNRLLPDGVASPEEALAEISCLLNKIGDPASKEVLFVGEGGITYRKQIVKGMSGKARFPTQTLQFPSAANVAERGLHRLARGEITPSDQAVPLYLRASQAELKWKAGRGKIRSSNTGKSHKRGG